MAKSCKDFLNSKNVGLAEQELISQFEALALNSVGFTHGLVQALYFGLLTYNRGQSPSNLSAFCFFDIHPLKNDQSHRSLILHIQANQGPNQSLSEIKTSTKQSVDCPMTIDALISKCEVFTGACTIFFVPMSPTTKAWQRLTKKIIRNKLEF